MNNRASARSMCRHAKRPTAGISKEIFDNIAGSH